MMSLMGAACAGLAVWIAGCGGGHGHGGAPSTSTGTPPPPPPAAPRYVVLLVADGWGYRVVDALRRYSGVAPVWSDAAWTATSASTFDTTTRAANGGVGYDGARAWSDLGYLVSAVTDSAASMTAMSTGEKTDNGNVAVAPGDSRRLVTLPELAQTRGLATGAVTTVHLSHATPAAWLAHNVDRNNGLALASEMLFGAPDAVGTTATNPAYGGGLGAATVAPAVVIGGGHPTFSSSQYVDAAIRSRLVAESGQAGRFTLVERVSGQADAGARLQAAANDPATTRLCGLFGGPTGNFDYRRADGSGRSAENPTLPEATRAALTLLARDPEGFALMVEGGAVDFAAHQNMLDLAVGEMIEFEAAVRTVVAWVDDPATPADWTNTLVLVTGDHECGLLTAGPGQFPDVPLGEVSARTLALEKVVTSTGRRASWEDGDADSELDAGEVVYWSWGSGGHSNQLVPLFARGLGAGALTTAPAVVGTDPVRGAYVDDTEVFRRLQAALP